MSSVGRLVASVQLSNGFWSEWTTHDDPILYHYTDAVGLCGILESAQLWLTSIAYLNDAMENQYAGVVLRKALEIARSAGSSEREARFYQHLDDAFRVAQESPRLEIDKQTFVCCFSSRCDSLSQWRGYAGGEGGFAIGFRASAIRDSKRSAPFSPGFLLLPCNYDEQRLLLLNQSFLQDAYRECVALDPFASDRDISKRMALEAAWIGAAMKHPSFNDEREWRLIYYGFGIEKPDINNRVNSTLTPYVKFDFGDKSALRNAIAEIWVGPQRNPELAASALSDLVAHKLGGEVSVRTTGIPFRKL